MSTVVQAKCPGCKQTLRIPSDWVSQAIRCKHCGLILKSKQPAAAPKPSGVCPPGPARTPPPAPRNVKAPPAPPSAAVVAKPAAPPPAAYPQAAVAPVAAVALAPGGGSPFDALDAEEAAPVRPSRYRRKSGPWWKGPAIALVVLLVAGVAAFFAWPYINGALFPKEGPAVADANPGTPDVKNPPTIETGEPGNAPAKPKDPKPKDPTGKANDPTSKPNPKVSDPKDTPKPADVPKGAQLFPRRALVISVQNYLYANPVHGGLVSASTRCIPNFLDALNKGLHIPMTEMAHLSDAAKNGSRSPMKPVIEKTITDFLDGSRAQDRIMVFFIGHASVIGDDTYLVPIEGEMDNADTLIPLKWVYEQMDKCKARQKVLVMDVNRLNPGHGLERPNGGPMDPKADAALKAPPDGVQVWTACVAGQQSYELDEAPMGLFLDQLNTALTPNLGRGEKGLDGKIQHVEDPLPLEQLNDLVNASMKEYLSPYKLEQTARLAGTEPKEGAPYNKSEPTAPAIALASPPASGNMKEIQTVLDEVGTPPIKVSREDTGIHFEVLPPFPADKMAAYPADATDSDLRKAVFQARAVMWALNTAKEPPTLTEEVGKVRKNLKVTLSVMKDGYRKPGDDAKFKALLLKDEQEVADMMAACEDALNVLKAAGAGRDKETKRWQANYDFTLARLEAQYAYLFEYQSMLGQMRKQLPDLAPGQTGWKMASSTTLKGDSMGKKLAKDSAKLLDAVIKNNPGTPWEVLAKREKLTALGLEWQGTKNE